MTDGTHDQDVVRSPRRQQPQRTHRKGFLIALGVAAAVAALAVVPRAFTSSKDRIGGAAASSTASSPTYVAPKVNVSALTGYRWRALPPAPIVGRYSEAAAWTGSTIIFWGGTSGNDVLGDGAAYQPS